MSTHHAAARHRFVALHLARSVAAALAVGLLAATSIVACGDDETGATHDDPPPTPAERMCALAAAAIQGCAAATACDQALVTDCAAVAGMLSDPYLAATADCIEAGGAPLSCLASSTGALAPTAAHRSFAAQFCSECLLGVPGCEDAFFGSDPGSDTAVVGALILPLGDRLVDAIRTECATGLQCLSFPSCAQGVLAKQAVPEATIQCVVDNLTGGGSGEGGGAPQGGDCSVGGGSQGGGGSGAGTACGARTYGACTECATSSCCAEMKACDDGTPCGALVTCENTCQDGACIDACKAANSAGTAALDAWDTCVQSKCVEPAGCDLGALCGTGVVSYDDGGSCDQCMGTACCAAIDACMDAGAEACLDCLAGGPCAPVGTEVKKCITQSCWAACSG